MENKRGRIEWKKANIYPMVKSFSTAAEGNNVKKGNET
jgi:hypothetical protein